ncbi:swi5-dependent recombination DNA repair protein 1 homolog [Vanessa cardui]|uniref:swi5-dependent recombination DNA repair protein 1 homolog n=1 Tax=Vanessa cardui TaxID=171605 RepID=UPI001F135194|nr:swi5-dependent recombination DNA repair protein 1 homolog [Vanessa cardui]
MATNPMEVLEGLLNYLQAHHPEFLAGYTNSVKATKVVFVDSPASPAAPDRPESPIPSADIPSPDPVDVTPSMETDDDGFETVTSKSSKRKASALKTTPPSKRAPPTKAVRPERKEPSVAPRQSEAPKRPTVAPTPREESTSPPGSQANEEPRVKAPPPIG